MFWQGALWALGINILDILAWLWLGPWLPAAVTVFTALAVLGMGAVDGRWGFAAGFWAVQLLAVAGWVVGVAWTSGMLAGV